jgi:hypothetical protein
VGWCGMTSTPPPSPREGGSVSSRYAVTCLLHPGLFGKGAVGQGRGGARWRRVGWCSALLRNDGILFYPGCYHVTA